MKLSKIPLGELTAYYEATNLVFDFYDNQAISNELENPEVYVESKKKRDELFKKSRMFLKELEKRIEEVEND